MEDHGSGRPDAAVAMLGLPGFVVLAAGEVAGELELLVETSMSRVGCPRCGVVATAHARRPHAVRDVPAGGRPVLLLVWSKRVWRCDEPRCAKRTWTEARPAIRARATLTERARQWACRRVGRDGAPVAVLARELGVGWNTVMRAVRDYGAPLVEEPGRLAGVRALGVDEHVWLHANGRRRTECVTCIVDITRGRPARLLDVVKGRTGRVYEDWINGQEASWREQITVASLDPSRGYTHRAAQRLAGRGPRAGRVSCREVGQHRG